MKRKAKSKTTSLELRKAREAFRDIGGTFRKAAVSGKMLSACVKRQIENTTGITDLKAIKPPYEPPPVPEWTRRHPAKSGAQIAVVLGFNDKPQIMIVWIERKAQKSTASVPWNRIVCMWSIQCRIIQN